MNDDRRRKSIYLRSICGIRKALIQNKRICFLTLTTNSASVEGLTSDEKMEQVSRDWNVLRTYLKQVYGNFEFLSVVTNEGFGVIHILIVGLPFIYWGKLARIWNNIHGMGFVFITKFKGSAEKMSSYLMSQYLAGQQCIFRFKMSNNFICKNFSKYWKIIKDCSRDFSKQLRFQTKDGFEFLYYPIDFLKLKENFIKWLRYFIIHDERLDYIPNYVSFL